MLTIPLILIFVGIVLVNLSRRISKKLFVIRLPLTLAGWVCVGWGFFLVLQVVDPDGLFARFFSSE